jgi:hypothetical protein
MEAKLSDSKIILPIGTEISLKMKGKNHMSSDVKLINGDEDSKFFALFTENDVDFEIEINNRKCNHGIGYTLALNDGFYDYYVGPREIWTMEALYSNGRKLHFLSQNTELGKQLVAETADKHNISYGEAAAICCKIEFTFEVEKEAEKPIPEPLAIELSAEFSEDCIDQFDTTGTLGAQALCLRQKSSSSISDRISSIKSSICGRRRVSKKAYSSLGVDSGVLCKRSVAAVPFSLSSSMVTPSPSLEVTDSVISGQIHSLAKPFPSSAVVSQGGGGGNEPQSGDEDVVGEKGVICFGETSHQIYSTFGKFEKNKSLEIKPFVIEMRMSAKN